MALCVAGLALGDIHLRFTWQAWHLATSAFFLRGRRGPLQTNPQLASVVEVGHGVTVVRIVYKIGALGGTVACEKQKEKRRKIKKRKKGEHNENCEKRMRKKKGRKKSPGSPGSPERPRCGRKKSPGSPGSNHGHEVGGKRTEKKSQNEKKQIALRWCCCCFGVCSRRLGCNK